MENSSEERLAIFDLDGTILDTLDDLADALNHALTKSGYPERSREEVCSFVGNGIRNLVARGVPAGVREEAKEKVLADFNDWYQVHCADKTRPYAGIPELLAKLRSLGWRTAVVSNKADYGVQKLCSRYFDGLFDAAVGERADVRRKPAPDSVYAVLRQLSAAKENAVYIGDSEVDLETAENAGMACIAVCWGFRKESFLRERGAQLLAVDVTELEEILLRGIPHVSGGRKD